MASLIDATKPAEGSALLSAEIRGNFAAAKSEIEAVQTQTEQLSQGASAIVTAQTTDGTLTTPLDGRIYRVDVSRDLTWIVSLPSGSTPLTQSYHAKILFIPPSPSGGPYTIPIPSNWSRLGGLDIASISISASSRPLLIQVMTLGDGITVYKAEELVGTDSTIANLIEISDGLGGFDQLMISDGLGGYDSAIGLVETV
jgi:hypothetical protein